MVDMTPIACSLGELGAVALRQARRTDDESVVNSLVAHHHYLGYRQPSVSTSVLGRRRRPTDWLLPVVERAAAPGAARHVPRLDPAQRARNLRYVAYQTRFLILHGCACRIWRRTCSAG